MATSGLPKVALGKLRVVSPAISPPTSLSEPPGCLPSESPSSPQSEEYCDDRSKSDCPSMAEFSAEEPNGWM
eukprot:scaffold198078_cov27-Tisochrysis_lutea.AAC.2